MIKSFRSKWTWIIVSCAFIAVVVLGAVLPFVFSERRAQSQLASLLNASGGGDDVSMIRRFALSLLYQFYMLISVLAVSVFAAFAGINVFRDELDSGVLLMMLAKPARRQVIFGAKVTFYFSSLFVYTTLLAIAHAVTVLIFNAPDAMVASSVILKAFGMQLLLGIIISILFGGIALFASVLLKSGLAAGVSVLFGMLPALTVFINAAARRPEQTLSMYTNVRKVLTIEDEAIDLVIKQKISHEDWIVRNPSLALGFTVTIDEEKLAAIKGGLSLEMTRDALLQTIVYSPTIRFGDYLKWDQMKEAENDPDDNRRAQRVHALLEARLIHPTASKRDPYRHLVALDFNYQVLALGNMINYAGNVYNNVFSEEWLETYHWLKIVDFFYYDGTREAGAIGTIAHSPQYDTNMIVAKALTKIRQYCAENGLLGNCSGIDGWTLGWYEADENYRSYNDYWSLNGVSDKTLLTSSTRHYYARPSVIAGIYVAIGIGLTAASLVLIRRWNIT